MGRPLSIWWSAKLALAQRDTFIAFTQRMANRIMQGEARYGAAAASQCYLRRLKLELRAYVRSGNAEHLFNVANYAYLECEWPEHKHAHLDRGAESATRGKVKL